MNDRAVILDVDGTLVDSNDAHAEAWIAAFTEFGITVAYDAVRRSIGMGGDKLVDRLLPADRDKLMPAVAGIEEESRLGRQIAQRRGDIFKSRHLPGIAAFPRVRELIQRLKEDGFTLAVASSAKEDELDPLLEAAGVKDLKMKVWVMPVQRPYNPNARRMAELIQADFAKVGVTVEIVSYEWAEYLKLSKEKNRDGAVLLGWTGDNGDPDNFLAVLLGCDGVGGNNRAQWCNKEFDDLVTKAKEASDQAERAKLYEQAQVVFKREAPWATLDHSLAIVPMGKEVTGFVQSPLGDFTFDGVDITE